MSAHDHREAAAVAYRVLHITDMHILDEHAPPFMGLWTDRTLQQVIDLALQTYGQPDLVLVTGDCVQQATAHNYQRLRTLLAPLQAPCYCLPGNHDVPALMRTHLNEDRLHYVDDLEQAGWRWIFLNSAVPNSAGGCLSEAELQRLQATLAAHSDQPTLVALHHQPLLVGSRWMDTMALPVANRARLLDCLAAAPQVKLVLFGHVHQVFDRQQHGLRWLATPSTCFQFKPNHDDFAIDYAAPGCRWLELWPDGRLDTQLLRLPAVPSELEFDAQGY